ncbi:FeS cluster assembly protein SufD [Brevundimonas sp. NIBR10]|uniref:Fe-S cluster assembly protein SufD n=1 Tax=Brevundimonas sp. NIBR10 TaxID=3015997 RepID=UPI0022F189D8|nr:Fe-S cluster assembly protein SufD [Brevundimonas sp. NIBR10]WGM46878.1 FeS cluster assembly protein SufD [Brevundimonas sp. NIBR10]
MTALNLRDASTFPSRRVEAWKYTDLRRVLREAPMPSGEAVVTGGGPFEALGGDEIAFGNGRAVGAEAFVASGVQTLRLRFVSEAVGTGHTASVKIAARPGARLLLLESHEGAAGDYVAHNRIDIDVAAGAEVTRIVLVEEPAEAISVTDIDVRVAPGAVYRQTTVTTGGKLQRQATTVAHGGEAAEVRLDGLYALGDARHTDLTSVVSHGGLNGETSQLTKGVVRDAARGVFQGKIVVERGADGTDARMGHHALILGERAEVDAKPELVIYADDVQCAHGNTVGNLDESALFYMQQRGIPVDEARALLTQAFLIEVVDRIEHEQAREVVRSWLTERL